MRSLMRTRAHPSSSASRDAVLDDTPRPLKPDFWRRDGARFTVPAAKFRGSAR
jgi:hypothetical protein